MHSYDIRQFFAKTILSYFCQPHQNKVRVYNREQCAYLYLSTNATKHGLSEIYMHFSSTLWVLHTLSI